MDKDTANLLEMLKKIDHSTYKLLENYDKNDSFEISKMYEMDIIHKRLYKLFNKIIDKSTQIILKSVDETIREYQNIINVKTGFLVSRYGAIKTVSTQNDEKSDLSNYKTYTIMRNKDGFYIPENGKDFNPNYTIMYDYCMNILKTYENEFNILHKYYSKKEEILGGKYRLKNNVDEDLPILIAKQLGYIKEDILKERKRS